MMIQMPLSEYVRRVFDHSAAYEASRFVGPQPVQPVHILLGLLFWQLSSAGKVFGGTHDRASLQPARIALGKRYTAESRRSKFKPQDLDSPDQILARARGYASQAGAEEVCTNCVLLALLDVEDRRLVWVLRRLRLTPSILRGRVWKMGLGKEVFPEPAPRDQQDAA